MLKGEQYQLRLPGLWPSWMVDPLLQPLTRDCVVKWQDALRWLDGKVLTIQDPDYRFNWPEVPGINQLEYAETEESVWAIPKAWLSPIKIACNCSIFKIFANGCQNSNHI